MRADRPESPGPRRVLVLGGTGTIGRATVRALAARGHAVVCLVRRRDPSGPADPVPLPTGVTARVADVTDPASLARDGIRGEPFDVLVSCLASRTGLPDDAWAIDYQAQLNALEAAKAAGVTQVVLLSAICVQKPVLAFQHAKLAFERVLMDSGLAYTIVRPTAFFKSLSGQIDRVRRGKPFLVFGDGMLTACKPISDDDLGRYLADCIDNEDRRNRVLPIGGPGDAITPKAQGENLFALLGREPRFRHVPVALLDGIIAVLATLGRWVPALAAKAELARIGRYYATESMLVLDPATGRYDANATPSTGSDTLFAYHARVVRGEAVAERGDHAVF
ncbi:NAD(P)H-binding protein [Methylobacterium pseudosasicola]|uniref:Divinyl chlorophyllide a 8-vinyl-reductase, chloroplastic n=1 Tax=Methylobacterium pseudosasicola TaxID=582667 RepID=A0A1I4F630_9HYPH|nr:NAD(P)H-binding protein [Methylobacterium pseudosasicola]SFL13418.1 divinylchlorophyllide 8-vinylreductase [Methylobacterium pseudosasicola]